MEDFFETLLAACVPVATVILGWAVKLFTDFFGVKIEEIKTRLNNDKLNKYIDITYKNAELVVKDLQQTVVDELKSKSEDGKLSVEEIHEVKQSAVNRLKATLTEDIQMMLGTAFGDIDEYLGLVIEKFVVDMKSELK